MSYCLHIGNMSNQILPSKKCINDKFSTLIEHRRDINGYFWRKQNLISFAILYCQTTKFRKTALKPTLNLAVFFGHLGCLGGILVVFSGYFGSV